MLESSVRHAYILHGRSSNMCSMWTAGSKSEEKVWKGGVEEKRLLSWGVFAIKYLVKHFPTKQSIPSSHWLMFVSWCKKQGTMFTKTNHFILLFQSMYLYRVDPGTNSAQAHYLWLISLAGLPASDCESVEVCVDEKRRRNMKEISSLEKIRRRRRKSGQEVVPFVKRRGVVRQF